MVLIAIDVSNSRGVGGDIGGGCKGGHGQEIGGRQFILQGKGVGGALWVDVGELFGGDGVVLVVKFVLFLHGKCHWGRPICRYGRPAGDKLVSSILPNQVIPRDGSSDLTVKLASVGKGACKASGRSVPEIHCGRNSQRIQSWLRLPGRRT